LPPVLSTLVKLTRLPNAEFKRRLASGAINPGMPCKAADLDIKAKTQKEPSKRITLPAVDKLLEQIADLAHGIRQGVIKVDDEFKQQGQNTADRLQSAADALRAALDGPTVRSR
jgi:hypothetical protein